ncbi:SAM-dependent methyltransferase [Streptosporangium becharense]|uniref:SAM-dependent methyltransferase n=1 Tax=Streptosporangium becharense TaxID=1816182 RepID=A0A7W9IDC0_9ACTN|nr:class I SAM-dependent methyltransferase [Streptosporangium becharense]MBB2912078.1 SAM-dependent methyltransferase [Streptosporangium becharense]MBB5818625.1 SAM-dependent methyltransferase [Streptosporangium becharense]
MDEARLQQLVEQVVLDMGAAYGAATVILGDRLGLWREMAGAGPLSAGELARRTGTNERLIAEWLAAQAAAGYVSYDDSQDGGAYTLTEEQATVFADESSPVFMTGLAEIASSVFRDEDKLVEAYRGDKGMAWSDHDRALFRGTERFFRPGYAANLPTSWIPALSGVEEKLAAGAQVADVGCGHGASTIVLAQAYPNSRFTGFDYHGPSVARARELADQAGVADRVAFETAAADDYAGTGYDLVCLFDCLHDMGDPAAALRHVRSTLASDGAVLLVEPFAYGRLPDDLNPVGRLFYNASATICVPNAISQGGVETLGAQAGQERLFALARQAGFTRTRQAAATPFNLVLELKA